MRHALALLVLSSALSACGPAHLRAVGLGGEREVGELFLGGWDGKRLRVFDDTVIEPGVTTREELVDALSNLSDGRYAALWVESAKMDEALRKHGAFCGTAMCVLVFARKGGDALASWGQVVAAFELTGATNQLVGSAWIAGDEIRPPGPKSWPLRCLSATDTPTRVHADGGAIFPDRQGPAGTAFALFDRARVPEGYRKPALLAGFQAPHEQFCDDERARLSEQPEPEKPVIDVDPSLLGKEAK